jgi:hypothetical protein
MFDAEKIYFYRIYPRYLCQFILYLPPSPPSSSSYPPSPQLVPRQYAAGRLPHQVSPVQAFLLPYVDKKCHNHGRGVRRSPPPTSRLAGLEGSNVSLAGLSCGRYGGWRGVVFGCMLFSGLANWQEMQGGCCWSGSTQLRRSSLYVGI